MSWKRYAPAAALAIVYLWAFPYFGKMRSANELPRVLLAEEIVTRGTFRLDARLGELGSRFDIATTPDGHFYSNKAPGVSLAAVPVVAAQRALWKVAGAGRPSTRAVTRAVRLVVVTVPCLLFLCWFWGLAGRFSGGEEAGAAGRRGALVAFALGSMALPYGLLFFSHAVSAVCAGGAFVAAVRVARGEARRAWLATAVCGLLAGAAVLVDYQALLASAAVGVYLVARAPGGWAGRARAAGVAGAAAAVPMVALLAYHAACYGSPWKTGYSFAADPAHQQGVLGIIGPNGPAMWNALLAPDNGLIVLMPWVLLAVVGAVVVAVDREARARVGAEAVVCGVVALVYVLFVGSLVPEFGRAGWSVGPRYIGVAMPFVAWLAAPGIAWCAARPAPRALAGALVGVGVVVMVVAAATYPHWPTIFRNPLYEVSLRALDDGMAPRSLGTALGLPGLWSLVPMFAAALGLLVWALGARPRRVALNTVVACALALGIVAAYSVFPRTGPAGHRPWLYVKSTWEP